MQPQELAAPRTGQARVDPRACALCLDCRRSRQCSTTFPSSSCRQGGRRSKGSDTRALERPCAYGNDEDLFTGTRTRTAQEKSARTTKSMIAQVMIAMGRPGSPPHSLRIRILLGTLPVPYLDACSVIRRGDDSRIRRIAVDGTPALSRASTVSKRSYLHLEHVHLQARLRPASHVRCPRHSCGFGLLIDAFPHDGQTNGLAGQVVLAACRT